MRPRTLCLLLLFTASLAVLALCTAGCSRRSGLERVVVHGKVTLNGSPVDEGQIHFIPVEGTAGPVTSSRIIGGAYECNDKGGVPVGKHRVELRAWDPKLPAGGRGAPM